MSSATAFNRSVAGYLTYFINETSVQCNLAKAVSNPLSSLAVGGWGSPSGELFLGPQEFPLNTERRSVQPFLQGTQTRDRRTQTYRVQTHHATGSSTAIGRIPCIRCGPENRAHARATSDLSQNYMKCIGNRAVRTGIGIRFNRNPVTFSNPAKILAKFLNLAAKRFDGYF